MIHGHSEYQQTDEQAKVIRQAILRGIKPNSVWSRTSTNQLPAEVMSYPFADEHGVWVMARTVVGDPMTLRKMPVDILDEWVDNT